MCRTLLKSLSRPPGLGEGEAVTDRSQSVGGSDSIGPRSSAWASLPASPPPRSLWLSPHRTPLHTCILLHILLPPASEALAGPEISTAGLTFHPLEQVCGLESDSLREARPRASWGLSRAALAQRHPRKVKVPESTSTFLGCRVLQELRGHSALSLSFLSRLSSAASQFLTSAQFSVNSLHPARLALTHKLTEPLLIAPIPPASGFLLY